MDEMLAVGMARHRIDRHEFARQRIRHITWTFGSIHDAVAAMSEASNGELFSQARAVPASALRGEACYIGAMTVTLTPEQVQWLEEAVAAGQFASVEEAVRVAVADLKIVP